MVIEELRDLLEKEAFKPFVIRTNGGRGYSVTHRTNAHIVPAYLTAVFVAVRGKWINLLNIASIEGVQFEGEVEAPRGLTHTTRRRRAGGRPAALVGRLRPGRVYPSRPRLDRR